MRNVTIRITPLKDENGSVMRTMLGNAIDAAEALMNEHPSEGRLLIGITNRTLSAELLI